MAASGHVTNKVLALLFAGRMDPPEIQRVLRHVGRCNRCRVKIAFFQPAETAAAEPTPAPAQRAAGEKPEKAAPPPTQAPPLSATDRKLVRTVEAFLEQSMAERFRDPQAMLDHAMYAAALTAHLPEERPGEAWAADLRARSLAELANAWRVKENFEAATQHFAWAKTYCRPGGDPLVFARLLEVGSSLATDKRRLGEALNLLDQAIEIYEKAGETHQAGRAWIKKGMNAVYGDRLATAADWFPLGIERLDPERDPQLLAIAEYSLLDTLACTGRFREASERLLASGLREAFAEEPLNLAKLRWLEGRNLAGLGKLPRAERALLQVREQFLEVSRHYEAALAGIDLSAVWLRQGRAAEVRKLADEMRATFERLEVAPEAMKALCFYVAACRQQVATPALVAEVATFLRRLENQPQLLFEPG